MSSDPVSPAGPLSAVRAAKDAHYAAIGKVAANWSLFERELDERTIHLGQLPIQAFCLAAQISGHGRKLNAYMAMADLLGVSEQNRKALNKLAGDAAKIGERRNRVVHDTWLLINPAESAHRFELTARKALKLELVHYPTPKVVQLAAEIDELLSRFSSLANAIFAERDASRGTAAEESVP